MTAINCDDSWGDALAAPSTITPPVTDGRPAAVLRGGTRGLEAVVHAKASIEAITAALTKRLAEAPSFFRGSDVRVRVEDGPLPAGYLTKLEELATQFELRIVEVGVPRAQTAPIEAIPQASTATGSSPAGATQPAPTSRVPSGSPSGPPAAPALSAEAALDAVLDELSIPIDVTAPISRNAEPAPPPVVEECPIRMMIGPVRSGVILEHPGHLVVFGDVNPGAEVRARGNIVVLGRLRGTAHAGIGRDTGFILALRLEAQQIRICRQVARAGDSDAASDQAEIAHLTGGSIIVEQYQGKLPGSLIASV